MVASITMFSLKCQNLKRHLLNSVFSLQRGRTYQHVHANIGKGCRHGIRALVLKQSEYQHHTRTNKFSYTGTGCVALSLAAAVIVQNEDHNSESRATDVDIDEKDDIIQMIKRAKLHERRQNFEEAEKMYHQALAQLHLYEQDKQWQENRILQARVYIFDSLANLALSLMQFKKAEALFKEVMKGLLQQGCPKNDNAIVEISLKLAMIYAMLGRVDDAKDGYEYCITLQESKVKLPDVDDDTVALLGLIVDSYSRFLMVQSKFPEALASMQKALSIGSKIFGDSHPQIAVLHNDLATVMSLMNDFEPAKVNVNKAIAIAKETESPDLASFLCNLGAIHLHLAEYEAAKRACQQAKKLAAKEKNNIAKLQAQTCLDQVQKKKTEHEDHA